MSCCRVCLTCVPAMAATNGTLHRCPAVRTHPVRFLIDTGNWNGRSPGTTAFRRYPDTKQQAKVFLKKNTKHVSSWSRLVISLESASPFDGDDSG
ncbi:uncharacterized protein RAG0_11599 [Rhynchosporium agropyri]|uniref:Uncharacterized protein n=1 Tax=Rhynchosporium agropyri TaxID=914238 RepID=A0A1E1L4T2_9HELO|nr:uncharacterized protein RAG0_11599 [Rhynchosporium agropyri]